jgi:hypothetical protein
LRLLPAPGDKQRRGHQRQPARKERIGDRLPTGELKAHLIDGVGRAGCAEVRFPRISLLGRALEKRLRGGLAGVCGDREESGVGGGASPEGLRARPGCLASLSVGAGTWLDDERRRQRRVTVRPFEDKILLGRKFEF